MMRSSLGPGLLLACSLFLLQATSVGAQDGVTVRGRVVDAEELEPVEDVLVDLGGTRFRAFTDAAGFFLFRDVPPGTYLVRVEHLGFARTGESLTIGAGEEVEIEIRMAPRAIRLAPLVVEVLSRRELEERSRGTARNLVTRSEIEEMLGWAMHVGDVLEAHVTGISVDENQGPGSYFCLEFRRPVSLLAPLACHPPAVVVDDVPVFDPTGYLNSVELAEIQSIEVLPAAEAGTRYGSSAANGVILIETRRPGGRSGEEPTPARTAYDWDLEPGGHPWARVFLGSAAGTAAGIGLVLAASGECSPLNEERVSECVGAGSKVASLAGFGLPVLTGAAGANVLGRTEGSRGDFLRTVALTVSPMLLGYFFATPRNGETVSGRAAVFGRILVTVGVPAVATLADHLFRSPVDPDPRR